jgi:hypothetical protein
MQTQGVTLHLERKSTHQGVVMSLANRATGYFKEEAVPFEDADDQWKEMLLEAATELWSLGPQLVRLKKKDLPAKIVTIEEDE